MLDYIDYSTEVKEAMLQSKPVVAIESAGTFEGFSYPYNLKVASEVIQRVSKEGAIAAYIAIVDGRIKIGLEPEEMNYLAKCDGSLMKASRRDLPMLLARKESALTAVAASMMIADLVGIKVVTGGGIGGVHRGAGQSFDISADLQEFNRTNLIVVCSGAKSILDLKLTMEYLETGSVMIAGYRTNELPAYMAIHSGCKLNFRLDNPKEVAEVFAISNELGMHSSLLLTNPIAEEYAVDSDQMNAAIEKAVKAAEENNITGKEITKYIMRIVASEMGEDSKVAGFYMNADNAELAAKIAVELNK